MGRKGRYETHVKPRLKEIADWYEHSTEKQIASKLGVSETSFEKYKKQYPELQECLKNSRENYIDTLKSTLKKKAAGYYYEETKTYIQEKDGKKIKTVEHYKRYAHPDLGAIHLLLKNLDDSWRNDDKTAVDIKKQQLEIQREKAENAAW